MRLGTDVLRGVRVLDFARHLAGAGGTRILANSDITNTAVPIGFVFSFYGRSYNSLSVTPKGLLTLGGTNNDFSNANLTNTQTTGNFPSIFCSSESCRTVAKSIL